MLLLNLLKEAPEISDGEGGVSPMQPGKDGVGITHPGRGGGSITQPGNDGARKLHTLFKVE